MTTVNENTFDGANAGTVGGYVPLTTIESAKMDADLGQVKGDLDTHLAALQAIYVKLDTIESSATADQSAIDIVALINASASLVDANNLEATVALLTNITSYIETHRTTTTAGVMHTEASIKSTGQTYSYTPTSIVTSCSNILDEINNVRAQIHKMLGQTTWVDTPDTTIGALKTRLDVLPRVVVVKCIPDAVALLVGDGKMYFTIPIELNGMNLTTVGAHVYTVSSSGLPTFQIHNLTLGQDVLSTKLSIDASEKDSSTATASAVINTAYDHVATGNEIRLDCDIAGTGTKGMEIRMGFALP